MDLFNLSGKISLVTGSGSGLGKTLARGLAEAGSTVIINGRNRDKVRATAEEFRKDGLEAYASAFDVTLFRELEKEAAEIIASRGAPDIVVNNAGINPRYPLEDFPEKEWNRVMDTNLKSAFMVSRVFVKEMIRRRSGKIINICSLQSKLGRATIGPYAASKGGLKMLTRAMTTEWARFNIQVNGIAPGYFKTDMTRPLYENQEFNEWLINRTPARRWGVPGELIGTLIFLCSDASYFVNGQVIYVDGGITASL